MPASGGSAEALTTVDVEAGETSHRWPQALPDGEHVLFTSGRQDGNFDHAVIEVVTLTGGERKVVHRGGSYARYVPTGHLVFVSEGTLFAIGFDLERLETRGSPVPLQENVASDAQNGGAQFDFSTAGRFVFMAESKAERGYPALWVDRDGGTSALIAEPGIYANPRFSPDGGRLALTVLHDENWDIWVYDITRGVSTRLTFDPGIESEQVWSPDGQSLIFSSDRAGADSLYRKSADGSGEVERLTEAKFAQWSNSWSRDGRYLSFIDSRGQYDIHTLDLSSGESTPFSTTEFAESFSDISPNGRFLAYSSNESGSYQIYVRPFPKGDGKWQVSVEQGVVPRWRADGRELFWRTADGIDSAAVETDGATFRAERPQPAIRGRFEGGMNGVGAGGFTFADYDVSPDGRRFVLFEERQAGSEEGHRHVTLLTRWFDRLEALEGLE